MSDKAFICFKCSKEFPTKIQRDEHQRRKRAGKYVGCLVNKTKAIPQKKPSPLKEPLESNESDDSLSSVALSDIPTDFDVNDYDFHLNSNDSSYNSEEYKLGNQPENITPKDETIQTLLRTVKLENSLVLNGKNHHHPEGEGITVILPSLPFIHGLVNAGVSAVLHHKEFDRKVEEKTDATIFAQRKYRDGLLAQLAVNHDQSNALQAHLCEASLCTAACTYQERRILFHK